MTSGKPQVSVVVPSYQAESTIDRCLEGLSHQTMARELYEVLLVDDGSTDETRVRARAYAGIRLFTQHHSGPAAARNFGARHAQGELVLFTDADCEPNADWIEQMITPFQDQHIVGTKGAYLSRQPELVARFVQMEYEEKYDWMAKEEYIDFIDTYAAAYRRDILIAHEGFDPVFTAASVEDQDFSFRLARQGYKMVFMPEARVYHWGHPPDFGTYLKRKFRIGYWKALVARRYPDKLVRDSHTPQMLKLQILLVGTGLVCLAACPLLPILAWVCIAAGLLFLLSTLPFAARAWRQDHLVAMVSPVLLFGRALALGIGFALGIAANVKSERSAGRVRS